MTLWLCLEGYKGFHFLPRWTYKSTSHFEMVLFLEIVVEGSGNLLKGLWLCSILRKNTEIILTHETYK